MRLISTGVSVGKDAVFGVAQVVSIVFSICLSSKFALPESVRKMK
jgi:hypothetical protein